MDEQFSSPKEERLILSGIIHHGRSLYFELGNVINEDCFRNPINRAIFSCIKKVLENESSSVDFPTIECAADTLGLTSYFNKPENYEYLISLGEDKVNPENCTIAAKKLRKLSIAKKIYDNLEDAQTQYLGVTGEESAEKILSIGQDAVFNINVVEETSPVKITTGMREYFKELQENENKQIGLSSGFKRWDASIGGGLRPGVTLVGARMKVGKSIHASNVIYHVSSNNIPVLNLDTEMSREECMVRMAARISGIDINTIESGKFGDDPAKKNALVEAYHIMDKLPYYHKNIAGFQFDEILSSVRSWLLKHIGLNVGGVANKCLIVLDYLKMMDYESLAKNKNLAEHQMFGWMMDSLTNLCQKYQVPVLAYVQLNRDGINSEETNAIAGSDRIGQICKSFSIFKKKSDIEISTDGPHNGNRKLIPIITRHGGGLEDKCYINCKMEGHIAKVTEWKTNFELQKERAFEINDDSETEQNSPQF